MLDCIWKLYLIFWGTSILFSVAAVPFYIPTFSTSSLWFIFVFKIIVSGILLFFVCHFPLWLVSVAFVAVLLTSLRWPVLKPACCGPHTQKGVCLVHWTVKGTLTEQCWGQGPCGWGSSSPGHLTAAWTLRGFFQTSGVNRLCFCPCACSVHTHPLKLTWHIPPQLYLQCTENCWRIRTKTFILVFLLPALW